MAFNRPTLSDLIARTWADIAGRLSSSDVLRRADASVFTRALSGLAHGIYGNLEWLARQLIYDTAESEFLRRWSAIWGVTPKAATYATGSVTLTGSNGVIIPAGAVLVGYAGKLYQTDVDVTISGGTVVAAVTAQTVGLSGNVASGQTFYLQTPISGVTASGLAGAMTGGADAETDASLLSRFLARLRQPPQGGSRADYVEWALSIAGVTRAWCYPAEAGIGTVTVRFMMDDSYIDGIPLSGDVATVQAYIDTVRPVAAKASYVVAPIAAVLDFTISGLSPDTLAVRDAVEVELSALIDRDAIPSGTLLLSHIQEAIGLAAGIDDWVLTSPATNVVSATGYISTMGTVTWL